MVRSECVRPFRARALPPRSTATGRHHLARSAAPLGLIVTAVPVARLALPALAADVRFVGLDDTTQLLPVLLHHRAEPVSQEPRRLVADVELTADDHARHHTLARRGEQEDRAKPCPKRQVRALHRRAVHNRELRPASTAHPVALALGQPERVVDDTALRTRRARRPAHRLKMREARSLRRKPVEEGNQIHDYFHKRFAYEKQ